jgi:hypothetical protein
MFGARILIIALLTAGSILPASANPFLIEAEPPAFTSTFALRYWYGMGSTSKDLYGLTRATLNSRLTYDGMRSHSAEIFTRVDSTQSGLFWRVYAGGGLLTQGNLKDEDFPPAITPYSSTNSTLQNQSIGYISSDFGGALLRGADFRVDAFAGYHYFHQRMKAFGCQETASNTAVCAGGIPDSVAVIVEDDTWQALRIGLNADFPIYDKLRINFDAAWLPYTWLNGTDNHLLRPDLPTPIPEHGVGNGYQLEALLSYQVNDQLSLGIGARYWHMVSKGWADFSSAGGTSQPLDFTAKIYGVFVQGSYKFNL